MADELSIKITVSGTDYYVSDDEYLALDSKFHFAFVNSAPAISFAPVSGGHIKIKSGSLVLDNLPQDSNHPFGSTRYAALLAAPETAYTCVINIGSIGYDFFTGVLVLDSINPRTLKFTIHTKQFSTTVGSSVTDVNAATAVNPFSFGAITHQVPVIQTGAQTFANPTGLTSNVSLYEDGSALNITSITASTITVDDYSANTGQVSISVTGEKTLEDFFDYVAATLSLTATSADTTRATGASSINLKIYIKSVTNLLDLANDVARATNHVFHISPDPDSATFDETLFLIDKEDSQTPTTLDDDDTGASYKPGFPIGSIIGKYDVHTIENSSVVTTQKTVTSFNSNSPLAKHETFPVFADRERDSTSITTLLDGIRDSHMKVQASANVPNIKNTWRFGDHIRIDKADEFLRATFQALSMTFNLSKRTTTASGPATLGEFIHVI